MVPVLYHLVFFFGIPMEWTMRTVHFILRKEIPLVEDTIPLFYLALMAINSDTFLNGFLLFALMQVCVILLWVLGRSVILSVRFTVTQWNQRIFCWYLLASQLSRGVMDSKTCTAGSWLISLSAFVGTGSLLPPWLPLIAILSCTTPVTSRTQHRWTGESIRGAIQLNNNRLFEWLFNVFRHPVIH